MQMEPLSLFQNKRVTSCNADFVDFASFEIYRKKEVINSIQIRNVKSGKAFQEKHI